MHHPYPDDDARLDKVLDVCEQSHLCSRDQLTEYFRCYCNLLKSANDVRYLNYHL